MMARGISMPIVEARAITTPFVRKALSYLRALKKPSRERLAELINERICLVTDLQLGI